MPLKRYAKKKIRILLFLPLIRTQAGIFLFLKMRRVSRSRDQRGTDPERYYGVFFLSHFGKSWTFTLHRTSTVIYEILN